MYGGCPPWGEFSPLPHYIRVDLTDTGDRVWVQLGRFHGTDPDGIEHDEDDLHVVTDPGVEPDAVISGTAEALDARIWRRGDGADTHLAGDLDDRRPVPRGRSTSRSPDRSPHRPTAVLGGSADSQVSERLEPERPTEEVLDQVGGVLAAALARIRSR